MPAQIPPWLQAADPAAHMARGMQIGVALGAQRAQQAMHEQQAAERSREFQQQMSAEQAAQQFKMQQAARQEQMAAQEQARADAELQLRASAAADKSKAILQYQSAVKGGMDPLQAILQFGPAMGGQASPEAAALRSQSTASLPAPAFVPANTQTGEPAHYVESAPGGVKRVAFPPRTTATTSPAFVPASAETGPAHWESGGRITQAKVAGDISASERAQTLAALRSERKALLDESPLIEQKLRRKQPLSDAEKDIAAQLQSITMQEQELLPRLRGSGTGSAQGGGVGVAPIKLTRGPEGGFVIAGQPQQPTATPSTPRTSAQSARAAIPGVTPPSEFVSPAGNAPELAKENAAQVAAQEQTAKKTAKLQKAAAAKQAAANERATKIRLLKQRLDLAKTPNYALTKDEYQDKYQELEKLLAEDETAKTQ